MRTKAMFGDETPRGPRWTRDPLVKTLTLFCVCLIATGCARDATPVTSSGRGALVAAPENAAPLTPGAITYPSGRTYRITKLDSNTMGASQTWTARGETILETRNGVTFRDQQTSAPVEVRGTYRIKPLP